MSEIIKVSVSRLVNYLKRKLEIDVKLQNINVTGEISNFRKDKSNHFYFTLKDEYSRINCIMFSSNANKLNILPKDGDKVVVFAKVTVYEKSGDFQLIVNSILNDGKGNLYQEFLKLKDKLYKQGLFDAEHKLRINKYPNKIAIIVAKPSAAYEDIIKTLSTRWPLATLYILPTLVQGVKASQMIIDNLLKADSLDVDTIILARGGGSIEDLWAFNDETLAHVIYNLKTPIISGIGHESDFTIADFVVDRREATPTAAASFVSYDINEIILNKSRIDYNLNNMINNKLKYKIEQLEQINNSIVFKNPQYIFNSRFVKIVQYKQYIINYLNNLKEYHNVIINNINKQNIVIQNRIDNYQMTTINNRNNIINIIENNSEINKNKLFNYINLLDAYSPLKILLRGYNLTLKDNKIIKNAHDIAINDLINIKFHDGDIICNVKEVNNENF